MRKGLAIGLALIMVLMAFGALGGTAIGAGKGKPMPFTETAKTWVTAPGTVTLIDNGILKVRDQIWNGVASGMVSGTIKVTHDAMIDLLRGTGTYHASFTITAYDGSTMYGKLRGQISNLKYIGTYPNIVFTGGNSEGSITIQGGTGVWDGVQGTGTYTESYIAPMTTASTITGQYHQ